MSFLLNLQSLVFSSESAEVIKFARLDIVLLGPAGISIASPKPNGIAFSLVTMVKPKLSYVVAAISMNWLSNKEGYAWISSLT